MPTIYDVAPLQTPAPINLCNNPSNFVSTPRPTTLLFHATSTLSSPSSPTSTLPTGLAIHATCLYPFSPPPASQSFAVKSLKSHKRNTRHLSGNDFVVEKSMARTPEPRGGAGCRAGLQKGQ